MHRRCWWLLAVALWVPSHVCHSFHIEQGTWTFMNQHPIAYERAATDNPKTATPILLLNGFGMGSFHQHRLMKELLTAHPDTEINPYVVYGMDYLGQGQSWPVDCADGTAPSEQGLQYSGRTWVNQIIQFIEQTILVDNVNQKVHLVGNSVGGYLAVCVAAERPDLVDTLSLLNATPIWGLNLPGWSGTLPAPMIPRVVGRRLFDVLREPSTIRQFLHATYRHGTAYDEALVQQVKSCTNGPGGHAAFASILWSPPVTVTVPGCSATGTAPAATTNFYDGLQAVQCDVLLLYGRNDPWCKPAFAKRMMERLQRRQGENAAQRYIELADVGHCPNHEAPKASALVLTKWLLKGQQPRTQRPLLESRHVVVREEWGETVLEERSSDQIPLGWLDRLAVQFI